MFIVVSRRGFKEDGLFPVFNLSGEEKYFVSHKGDCETSPTDYSLTRMVSITGTAGYWVCTT